MGINTIPPEVLEKIFESITYDSEVRKRIHFRQLALVCKKWSVIIVPMIWKEIELTGLSERSKSKAFSFYRHIINPNCLWGRHIRTLNLIRVSFWPICIAKILTTCPYIVDLKIFSYNPYDRYNYNNTDFLENILRMLPYLKRLDLSQSHYYFGKDMIQQVIDKYKNIDIRATRYCLREKEVNCIPRLSEKYERKKWHCVICKTGKYASPNDK